MNQLESDIHRQATSAIRGYSYQVLYTLLRWINLEPGDRLYLEGAEDLDLFSNESATTIQVKETRRSGPVTLRTDSVKQAINNFWTHQQTNKDCFIVFNFVTTSERGFEKSTSFGHRRGLDVWDGCKTDDTDMESLRSFLRDQNFEAEELQNFLRDSTVDQLRKKLISRIEWITGEKGSDEIYKAVEQKIIGYGNRIGLVPSDSRKVIAALEKHVWEISRKEDGRWLSPENFYEIFEAVTMISVPIPVARRLFQADGRARENGEISPENLNLDLDDIREQYCSWLSDRLKFLRLPNIRPIPLEKVYVTLRAVKANQYELVSSKSLIEQEFEQFEKNTLSNLSREEIERNRWKFRSNLPYMPTLVERDLSPQFEEAESYPLDSLIAGKQRMVILGDPGCGKTTLACWLALQSAQSMLSEPKDASAGPDKAGEDEAPAVKRLPILLRIADFASALKNATHPSLIEYLGHHPWNRGFPEYGLSHEKIGQAISPADLNSLFKYHLKEKSLLVILDGLDEVTTAELREKVISAVDEFVERYIESPGTRDLGERQFGNQIVITSRIAGYHDEPLNGDFSHFTIEPLSRAAIDEFCETQLSSLSENNNDQPAVYRQKLKLLLKALSDETRTGLRELSSNPLLLSLLTVIFYKEGTFPHQRAELYRKTFRRMLEIWKQRKLAIALDENAARKVLASVAVQIHEFSTKGFIPEEEIREELHFAIKQLNDPRFPVTEESVDKMIHVLREESGLIVARSQTLYGFIHLTFQEYFAGLWLISEESLIASRISEKIEDPRWREPILLGLGQLDLERTKDNINGIMTTLLDSAEPLTRFLPNFSLLFAAAASDLQKVDSSVWEKVAGQLIMSYSSATSSTLLQQRLEDAIEQLWKNDASRPAVEKILIGALNINAEVGAADTTVGASRLIFRLKLYTRHIVESLIKALPRDDSIADFPINSALHQVAFENPEFISSQHLPFRQFLQSNLAFVEKIREDSDWLRLILALYGGFGRDVSSGDAASSPEALIFSETLIYRDSFLTPLIKKALRNDKNIGWFLAELELLWPEIENDGFRSECLIAFLALGYDIGDYLKEVLNDERYRASARFCLASLQRLADSLRLVTGRASSDAISSVVASAGYFTLNEWTEIYRNLLSIYIVNANKKGDFWIWAEQLEEPYFGYAIAEAWAAAFSLVTDDPVYHLAVSLDTIGAKIARSPKHVARGFAMAHKLNRPEYLNWRLPHLPFPPESHSEMIGQALDAVDLIQPRFVDAKNWALEKLSPLMQDFPEWTVDALIVNYTIEWKDFKMSVMEKLSPGFSGQENQIPTLIKKALEITDHFAAVQTIMRLVRKFPLMCLPLLPEALKRADRIPDSFQKSASLLRMERLCAQLFLFFEPEFGNSLAAIVKNDFLKSISSVTEPNRKLYFLQICLERRDLSEDAREKNVSEMFGIIEKTPDPLEKLKMLRRIWKTIKAFPVFTERWNTAVAEICRQKGLSSSSLKLIRKIPGNLEPVKICLAPVEKEHDISFSESYDEWKVRRAKVRMHAQTAPSMFEGEELLGGHGETDKLSWAIVQLYSSAEDLNSRFSLPDDLDGLCKLLSDPSFDAHTILSEIERFGESLNLELSSTVAEFLDKLNSSGDSEQFRRLLRLASNPQPETVPIIEKWLDSDDDEILSYASLLLIEAGHISGKTVPNLYGLMKSNDDLLRSRMHMAFYGPLANKKFSVRAIGSDSVESLAEIHRSEKTDKGSKTSILWFWETALVHDEPDLFEKWVRDAREKTESGDNASHVLKSIHRMTINVWTLYRRELIEGTRDVRIALLRSARNVLGRYDLSETIASELSLLLREIIKEEDDHEILRMALYALGEIVKPTGPDIELLKEFSKHEENIAKDALVSLGRVGQRIYDEDLRNSVELFLSGYAETSTGEVKLYASAAYARMLLDQMSMTNESIDQMVFNISQLPAPPSADASETINLDNLRKRHSKIHSMLRSFLESDGSNENMLDALRILIIAGRDVSWGVYHNFLAKFAAEFIFRHPEPLIEAIVEISKRELINYKPSSLEDNASAPLAICAETARLMPASIQKEILKTDTRKLFIDLFDQNSWVIRRSIVSLMGYTFVNSIDTARIIKKAVMDVPHVQGRAFQSAQRFTGLNEKTMDILINELEAEVADNGSPAVAYALANLLAVLTKSDATLGKQKRKILGTFAKLAETPFSDRRVYRLQIDTSGSYYIEVLGKLNQHFRDFILDLILFKYKGR